MLKYTEPTKMIPLKYQGRIILYLLCFEGKPIINYGLVFYIKSTIISYPLLRELIIDY